jgi:predicted RNA-binding Zn-ribbon protein involved in translation (DUF1610 family)
MSTITFDTHEQVMACLSCGLAGFVPESHFPLAPGLWDSPCPQCGAAMVWITEIREQATDTGAPPP